MKKLIGMVISAIACACAFAQPAPPLATQTQAEAGTNNFAYMSPLRTAQAIAAQGGGGGAPTNATYITQTPNGGLSAEQALSLLGTGILKSTTTTGVLSIAVAGDFPTLNQNTTGSAATLTTARTIGGSSFDGSANVTSFPSPGAIGGSTPAAGTFTTGVFGSTTSLLLGTAGSAVGNIGFRNATSGTATLAPPTGALGTYSVTLPNAASTLPIFGQQITFTGPTAARTITIPDAAWTAARTDAAQTFTGVQSMTSPDITTSITTPSTTFALINATATTVNAFGAATTVNTGASATQIWNFGGSTTASEFRFLEPSGSGTNYTAIKAVAQGSNITYSLPPTVGGANTFLTDVAGNGVLTWGTPSGSGNVTNSGTLTDTAIATGAGTTVVKTPSATSTLDASGNMALAGNLTVSGTAGIVAAGSATGILQVTGVTSGAFKITGADAMAQTVTLSTAAQTSGATTITIPDMAGVSDTIGFLAKAQTITGIKTFSAAPVFNALPTGSAVASAATVSTIVTRDSNGNINANSVNHGYTTTATAAGTTTLTVGSTNLQYFTGSTTQTVLLPVTSTLVLGQRFVIENNSTGLVTVQSSGANNVLIQGANTSATYTCILTSGTTAASWNARYIGTVVATGKAFSVSNSLTLAGTDATTMTFPSTSATIARTDAANTFTGASTTTSWAETTPVITGGLTASGSGANTFAGSTGTFLTSTGAVTIGPGAISATGTITLAENTSIALDPAGSADGKYTGITVTGTGGATIAFGDLVTLDKDDSRWELVDISVAAAATGDARGIIGIAVTSSTDGGAITVMLRGIIRADANFPTLTIGAAVYASTTGDVVVAQPTTADYVIRIVGFGLTADEMYFCPDNTWITHI